MEGFPSEVPSPAESSFTSKEVVISELKKGIEKPGVRELFNKWCDEQEATVHTRRDQLHFEMLRAEVYRESGHLDAAMETLQDAFDVADQEGMTEFMGHIDTAIRELIDRGA